MTKPDLFTPVHLKSVIKELVDMMGGRDPRLSSPGKPWQIQVSTMICSHGCYTIFWFQKENT